MRKSERKEIYSTYLNTLLTDGGSNNFVIFTDPLTKRFIQFAGSKGNRLVIIDLPKKSLLTKEEERLITIFVLFEEMKYSFQCEVTPEQGVLIAEKVFLDVFEVSDDYTINAEITLD
jgi:hypothetical protein